MNVENKGGICDPRFGGAREWWTGGVQADNDMGCPHRMHGPDKRRTKSNSESPCPRFASPEEVGFTVL